MEFTIEPIPTLALCYLINDDRSGLTEEEVTMIDRWYNSNRVVTITTASEEEGECSLTSHTILLSDSPPKS